MSLVIAPQLVVPPFKKRAAASFSKAQTGVAAYSSGTTVSVSLAADPQPGHVICVGLGFYDGVASATTVSVVDGNGNAYTVEPHDSGATNADSVGHAFLAYLANTPSNASKTITATFGRSSVVVAIWVDDFVPSSGVPAYDDGAFASGTGAINTPIIPVSGPNELLYALALDANDAQPAQSPWTNNEGGAATHGIGSTGWFASWILSASANTAVKYPGTSGNAYNAVGMSFKILPASAGFATPAYVNGGSITANGSATTLALPAQNHTAGNFILVMIKWESGLKTLTLSDTAGNTYTPLTQRAGWGNDLMAQMFYAKNIAGNASNVITISGISGATYKRAIVHQYSGIDTVNPFDQENFAIAASAGTAIATGNITTTAANELIVGFAGEYAPITGYTPGANFTERIDTSSSGDAAASEDRVVTAIGTYNASMTCAPSAEWIALVASFKAASL